MREVLMAKVMGVKAKAMNFICDESGEVNIVTTVVLIGVAVALALVFRTEIESLITTLLGSIKTNATTVITP